MNSTASPPEPARAGLRLAPLLLLFYPLLVQLMVATAQPLYGFAAICVLAVLVLAAFAPRVGGRIWWLLPAVALAAGYVCFRGDGLYLLYLPPVLFSLALMAFFGRTLLPGSTPLITRISRQMRRGMMPEEVARYTRRVTLLWTGMFGLMALEAVLLALFASPRLWSLFTNFINYAAVAALMVGEYLYHSRRYPNGIHHSFLDFARDLVRVDYKRLLDD